MCINKFLNFLFGKRKKQKPFSIEELNDYDLFDDEQ